MNHSFFSRVSWPSLKHRQRNSAKSSHDYQTMESRALMCASPAMPDNGLGFGSFQDPIVTAVVNPDTGSEPRIGRIVNGTQTSQYPSVGMIGDNSGFFCSGTLIGSRYVLTAAHCAEGVAQTAGRFQVGSQTYSTSRIFVHPNYNSNLIGSDNANDIAIYELNRDVTGISPTQIFRSTPAVGQLLTIVGFGGGGNGNTGHDGSFGVKRVGTTPIDQVTPKLIKWRFDNNSEANTAPGDSGGPGFVTINGVQYVAGITSGGDQENAAIGDNSYDTRVDAFASWIDSIVGAVSQAPTVSITSTDTAAAETLVGQALNTASFTISRTGALTSPLSVRLSFGGTATSGVDYNALPTTVTIPAGSASTTMVLTPRDDAQAERTETTVANLAAGTGYQLSTTNRSVSLSILDNDTQTWNNQFASRFVLSGTTANATGTNVAATRENGEPNVLNVSGGKSVWWSWTAPANGNVTISTAGSNFDTTLGIYTGTAVNQLTLVRANDDQNYSGGVYTSRVNFNAVAGRQYQILVDGYQGEAGSVRLSIQQAANRNSTRSTGAESNSSLRSETVGNSTRWNGRDQQRSSSNRIEQRDGSRSRLREQSSGAGIVQRSADSANRLAALSEQSGVQLNHGPRMERMNRLDAEFSRWFAEDQSQLDIGRALRPSRS